MKNIIIWLIGIIVTGLTLISYLPQTIKLIKTKSSQDISDKTWFMFSLAASLYLILFILEKASLKIIILQSMEVFLCWMTLILSIIYKKKEKNKHE